MQIGRHHYEVIPPETSISVARGRLVAIPLYDGDIVALGRSSSVLRYVGVASIPPVQCVRTAAGSAASHRVALFRAVGRPSDGATVLVLLRLPELREQCTSCRTVHFFVHVR